MSGRRFIGITFALGTARRAAAICPRRLRRRAFRPYRNACVFMGTPFPSVWNYFTVTLTVALTPLLAMTVIVQTPLPTPLTIPDLSTFATLRSLLK